MNRQLVHINGVSSLRLGAEEGEWDDGDAILATTGLGTGGEHSVWCKYDAPSGTDPRLWSVPVTA